MSNDPAERPSSPDSEPESPPSAAPPPADPAGEADGGPAASQADQPPADQPDPPQADRPQADPQASGGDGSQPTEAQPSDAPQSGPTEAAPSTTQSQGDAGSGTAASQTPPATAPGSAAGETTAAGSAEAGPLAASKIQVGSRRGEGKKKPRGSRPQTPTADKSAGKPAPPKRTGPVPVPSIRSSSEELDREVEAALGGSSLDDLIRQQDAEGAEALELESKVEGTVVKIHGDNVFFNLGGRNEGVTSLRQFPEPPEPGQKLQLMVAGVSRDDGLYEVTVPGAAINVDDWSDLTEGAVVEARVTGSNTGGLECKVNNIRGFIPASQISMFRVENFNEYIDQKLNCVVTEANPGKKNLVLSHRAVLEREKEEERKKVLEELEVGQIREGVVRNIRDFGAFVDLGGVDGLIHISQLSWERVDHPKDVVSEGEKVRVRVEKIDPQSGKIGLSYRSLQEHPWTGAAEKFPVGSTVPGTVSRIANFGAFVKLAPGVEGLVHVSELAHHRVSLVNSIVKEGEEVNVKVLSVDEQEQRISLSIKQTTEAPRQEQGRKRDEPVEEAKPALPKHEGPLKGGVDKPSGGEKFGLNW